MKWKYDRDEATITDEHGVELATLKAGAPDSVGELMALAPEMLDALIKIKTFNEVSDMLICNTTKAYTETTE